MLNFFFVKISNIKNLNLFQLIDPLCPVFTIDYILKQAEKNETERYLMLLKVSLTISSSCACSLIKDIN